MLTKNPFSPAFPVRPEFFVNRASVLNSFRKAIARSQKLKTPTPDNLAILGSWGMGKTSVFRKFESILLREFPERSTFFSIVEIAPSSGKNLSSFVSKIIEDVSRNFNTSPLKIFQEIKNKIRNWEIKHNQKTKISSPTTQFKDALLDLWKILQSGGVDTAVLMLDDLHHLTENHPEYLYDLWSIFQSLPKYGCNFTLSISSQENVFSEINGPVSRFFNLTHVLSLFSSPETKKVILKPLLLSDLKISPDEEVIRKIHQLTGGHPFFIHFIMRELLSLASPLQRKISLKHFNRIYPRIRKLLEEGKFRRDFSLASEKGRKILLSMPSLKEKFSPSEIPIKDARTHLRFLLKKNLIVKHDRGEYSLYHPLFREYLKRLGEKKHG
jgi:hypothetical protein